MSITAVFHAAAGCRSRSRTMAAPRRRMVTKKMFRWLTRDSSGSRWVRPRNDVYLEPLGSFLFGSDWESILVDPVPELIPTLHRVRQAPHTQHRRRPGFLPLHPRPAEPLLD